MRRTAVLSIVVAAAAVTAAVAGVGPSAAESHGVESQVMAKGAFTDDIEAKIKLKQEGAETQVIHVDDPSDIVVARISFAPGGSTGWHTHPGPVFATVASGTLTIINAGDCRPRTYTAGQAFVDPGHGNVHIGLNETDEEAVVYATFLEVPADGKATIPVDGPAGCGP